MYYKGVSVKAEEQLGSYAIVQVKQDGILTSVGAEVLQMDSRSFITIRLYILCSDLLF